jgi:hypothetical protein
MRTESWRRLAQVVRQWNALLRHRLHATQLRRMGLGTSCGDCQERIAPEHVAFGVTTEDGARLACAVCASVPTVYAVVLLRDGLSPRSSRADAWSDSVGPGSRFT